LLELPDIKTDEPAADQEDLIMDMRKIKNGISPIDISREDETSQNSLHSPKPITLGSCVANDSEHHHILVNFNALTGDTGRDKGLAMLLQNVQYLFDADERKMKTDKCGDRFDAINNEGNSKSFGIENESKDKVLKVLLEVPNCGCDLLCGFIYFVIIFSLFSLFLEVYNL